MQEQEEEKAPSSNLMDEVIGPMLIVIVPLFILGFLVYSCSETKRESSVDDIMGRTSEEAAARNLEIEKEIQAGRTIDDVYRESSANGFATILEPAFVATKREFAFLIGIMNKDEIGQYSDDDTILYLTKGTSVRVIRKDENLIEGEVQTGVHFGKRVFVPLNIATH